MASPNYSPLPGLSAIRPLMESNISTAGYRSIYDCFVMIVHCPAHQKFMLCNSIHSGQHFRWFPFAYMSPKITWEQMRKRTLELILGRSVSQAMVQNTTCLNILRLQMPRTQLFVTRLVYYVRLEPELIDLCNIDPKVGSPYLQWYSIDEATTGSINNLWGPDVVHYMNMIKNGVKVEQLLVDYSTKDAFAELPVKPNQPFKGSKVTYNDIERLYDDYIEHCFPSFFMSQVAFQCFMTKHAIETDQTRLDSYWNAFRPNNKPKMSFRDLAFGMVNIDRKTPRSKTRLKFIFKFYDLDCDECLNIEEFRRLVSDTDPNKTNEQVQQKCNTILNHVKYTLLKRTNLPAHPKPINNACLGFNSFLKAVSAKIIVGTSQLCRSKVSVFRLLAQSLVSRRIQLAFDKKHSFRKVITSNSSSDKCSTCVARNQKTPYRVARHLVLLTDTRKMKQANRRHVTGEQTIQSQVHLHGINHSVEVQFNNMSLPNLYIYMVRLLSHNHKKGDIARYNGLFAVIPPTQQQQFVKDIEKICKATCSVLKREPLVVDIRSPVTVIGDIHGNIEDLLTLEQNLWPTLPFFSGNSFLFLGDYVDRGRWGFESVLYLFCLKLLAPGKFTLLRGNHEDRTMNNEYSYKQEMLEKYGEDVGSRFYELTNKVFDCLPCGAIVDNAVFCAHGGIPNTNINVPIRDATKNFPREIPKPDLIELVWQLLWSDPVDNKQFREEFYLKTDLEHKKNKGTQDDLLASKLYQLGFQNNRKRGTACLFNEVAFEMFCKTNSFSHMVRAHEVHMEGYRLDFHRRCITTFSCSKYCGLKNECSVVSLQDNRIRIIQIDTKNNNTATPEEMQ